MCRSAATRSLTSIVSLRRALTLPPPSPLRPAATGNTGSIGRFTNPAAVYGGAAGGRFQHPVSSPLVTPNAPILLNTAELTTSVIPFLKFFVSPATYDKGRLSVSHQMASSAAAVSIHPLVRSVILSIIHGSANSDTKSIAAAVEDTSISTNEYNVVEVDEEIDGFSD